MDVEPPIDEAEDGSRTASPSIAPLHPHGARLTGAPPTLPPPSMRTTAGFGFPGEPMVPARLPSPTEPSPTSLLASTRRFSPAEVSPELRALLAEAEEAMQVPAEFFTSVPSPEEEIESVLPAELLAALDVPIEEDDAEDEPVGWLRAEGTSQTQGRTSTGEGSASTPSLRTSQVGERGGSQVNSSIPQGVHPRLRDQPAETHPMAPDPEQVPTLPPTEEGDVFGPHRAHKLFPPAVDRQAIPSVVAKAIANRATGAMAFATSDGVRRLTFREGDLLTVQSTTSDDSLVAFLGIRGDLPRDTLRRLGNRFPALGRHAGAALVARGYLRQDQMWPTLRAHAEWLLGRIFEIADARLSIDSEPEARSPGEPGVFGGSTGAAVFVDVVRRVIAPADAIARLGGRDALVSEGDAPRLLDECALDASDVDRVRASLGRSLGDALERSPEGGIATVLFALAELGVVGVHAAASDGPVSTPDDDDTLDDKAERERIRARLQLVEEGDYFALLGVPRNATGYEIRRAFLELRRAFEPSKVSMRVAPDLVEDLRTIVTVLEEAYDVLKDSARRERYRRAIEMPGG